MIAKEILVVGGGLGGLALAARLQHRGHRVTIVEKNAFAGGRCGTLDTNGYHFDLGPTLLLMPDVLEQLFSDIGRKLSDYVTLQRLDPNYRLHFSDGTAFDFQSDRERMISLFDSLEPGGGAAYVRFLDDARYCYQTARAKFVERNFRTAFEFFTGENLMLLFRMRAHRRLYSLIASYFRDPRLRQALSFQTMYLGLSPYKSPALYTLLPYTELEEGIWYPMGGMHRIATAIARVFEEDGGTIRYSAPVASINVEGGRATGVTLESGETLRADIVVSNADLPYTADSLLPRKKRTRNWKFTSSGFLLHLGLRRRYDSVPHHSIVFSRDYEANFNEIFESKTLPRDPAFYICRPTATDSSVAPEGHDVLYVLAPMPHLQSTIDWNEAAPALREMLITRMESLGMPDLREQIEVEKMWTPRDFATTFNLAAGCAFGLSHDILQVGYLRPHNRDAQRKNLYYVGASTHPGTGIPMVLFSAALVDQRIAQEWQ